MKKILFASAIAAIALSGCSNEITESFDTQKGDKPSEIKVEAYTCGATRLVDTTLNMEHSFYMLMTTTENNETKIIFNDEVIYNDAVQPAVYELDSDDPVYWPGDVTQKVNFYAIYGEDGTANATSFPNDETKVQITPTLKSNWLASDVVAANQSSSFSEATQGVVTLNFNHIMSKVTMKIMGEDGFSFDVSELSLTGSPFDTYDVATKSWSYNASQEFAVSEHKYEFISSGVSFYSDGNGGEGSFSVEGDGKTAYEVLAYGEEDRPGTRSMLLVPGTYKLEVKYTASFGNTVGPSVTKTANVTLEAGKNNVLLLSLTSDMNPIGVSASVTDWPTDANTTPTLQ